MSDDEDAGLLAEARAGSAGAFGRLVDRHQQAVRGFLRRISRNHADADDLAQDAFLAAWENLGSYRGVGRGRSWFCAFAGRTAHCAWRAGARRRARDGAFLEREDIERAEGLSGAELAALRQAMETLPIEQRAAVALCLGGSFSHGEAADARALPLGTIPSHVARGRAKLLGVLGESE
jgi:RNA polymerase sigma-70 factor (ECF subfamily)